ANIQERQLINAIDKTTPDVDNKPGPDVDNKPGPDVDIDAPRDVYLVSHGDTAHMFVNGEEVRTATLDVTSEGNYTITGSEGATFHVVGNDVLVTMVNGESVKLHNVNRTDDRNISFSVNGENYNLHRTYNGEVWVQKEQGNGTGNWATVKTGADVLANIQERQLINAIDKTTPDVDNKPGPDVDNGPILPEISGGEGAQELKIVDGGIFFGGEKIGFIASDGNVNLYKHGKVGTAVYNGEGTLTAIKGDNGRELALRDDRVTLVGERGSVTMIREDGSIRIDHNYTNLVEDGADVKQLAKNIDRSKLQNIKTKVMSKLAK
ncbi:hypothetical protein, partial [Vibrio sp. 1CM8B]|uniref:hypothetical protein n=1 Tax=Vibrio sp. 1CM8B TaxID=2929167 RepID=UPI0020BEF99B